MRVYAGTTMVWACFTQDLCSSSAMFPVALRLESPPPPKKACHCCGLHTVTGGNRCSTGAPALHEYRPLQPDAPARCAAPPTSRCTPRCSTRTTGLWAWTCPAAATSRTATTPPTARRSAPPPSSSSRCPTSSTPRCAAAGPKQARAVFLLQQPPRCSRGGAVPCAATSRPLRMPL